MNERPVVELMIVDGIQTDLIDSLVPYTFSNEKTKAGNIFNKRLLDYIDNEFLNIPTEVNVRLAFSDFRSGLFNKLRCKQ